MFQIEFRQLNTFVMIAQLGSFTKAAETLGYAQSSITTQIQLLEEELGIKLFERLGKSVFITQAGQKLLLYANQIINIYSEAKSVVSGNEFTKNTLTVAAGETLCAIRLPGIFNEYHKRYPGIELILKRGIGYDFKRFLRENTIDIAFFIDRRIKDNDFVCEIAFDEVMEVISSPGYPLACKEYICEKDLENESFILTERGCSYREVFENILSNAGVQLYSVQEMGSVQAIKQFIMGGFGVTFLPHIAIEEELKQNKLVALPWNGPDFAIMTQIVYHKNKWISAPIRAFIDLIKEMFPIYK